MASLGRITNSLVSGVNENSIALAQLNFDFSLVRVEAPPEYSPLGNALCIRKKENAESGVAHRTARKLGALFESIVPAVPKLLKTYGKRCAFIIEAPDINPRGNPGKHGPFAEFVGADATTIWAAATSGAPSLAIHLLACMLARTCSDPAKTTSIWVELIAERKQELEALIARSSFTAAEFGAINARSQDISRAELGSWDASARSWLRSGDSAMRARHKELDLILKNIELPIAPGAKLYDSVIRAWTQAMEGLERLLSGSPQSVTDGAILLAISSWHLYPNLLVCGPTFTKNITSEDPLMTAAGLLTVGISISGHEGREQGIYWSLPLSHYRHYGRPVHMVSDHDDRLTLDEFHIAVLGSLFRAWEVPRRDPIPAARWVVALWSCIKKHKHPGPETRLHWIDILGSAADRLLKSDETQLKYLKLLLDYGYRRGSKLFTVPTHIPTISWLGLRSPQVMHSLCEDSALAGGIQYWRHVAKHTDLGSTDALISVIWSTDQENGVEHHIYATPQPLLLASSMAAMGTDRLSYNGASSDSDEDKEGQSYSHANTHPLAHGRKEDYRRAKKESVAHCRWVGTRQGNTTPTSKKTLLRPPKAYKDKEYTVVLSNFISDRNFNSSYGGSLHHVFATIPGGLPYHPAPLIFSRLLTGDQQHFQLWIRRMDTQREKEFVQKYQSLTSGAPDTLLSLEQSTDMLQREVSPSRLWGYLDILDHQVKPKVTLEDSFLHIMSEERAKLASIMSSLGGIALATRIYSQCEGASISSAFIEICLADVAWTKMSAISCPTRSDVISCLVLLETGTVNLPVTNLGNVFGISVGNSIFVFSRLLQDPTASVNDTDITRLIGNIGQPGVSLLVPPAARPLIRELSRSYRAVGYADFDGTWEDNFKGTSMHLRFTPGTFPVDYGAAGVVDHQVFFVESVVSVHDGGKWVADLDILPPFDCGYIKSVTVSEVGSLGGCDHSGSASLDFIAIDSWEEILDTPPGIGVVRAQENWPARLSIAVLLSQHKCHYPTEEYHLGKASTSTSSHMGPGVLIIYPGKRPSCLKCLQNIVVEKIEGWLGKEIYIIS